MQRHQDAVPSVAALLTMSVSGGALASPLVCAVSPYGLRESDALVLVFTMALAVLLLTMRRKNGIIRDYGHGAFLRKFKQVHLCEPH